MLHANFLPGEGSREETERRATGSLGMEIVGAFQLGSDEVNRTWQLVGVFQSLKSSPSFRLEEEWENGKDSAESKVNLIQVLTLWSGTKCWKRYRSDGREREQMR